MIDCIQLTRRRQAGCPIFARGALQRPLQAERGKTYRYSYSSPVNIPVTKQRQCILICPKAPNLVILTVSFGVGENGKSSGKPQAPLCTGLCTSTSHTVETSRRHSWRCPNLSSLLGTASVPCHVRFDTLPRGPTLFVVLHPNQKFKGTPTIPSVTSARLPRGRWLPSVKTLCLAIPIAV